MIDIILFFSLFIMIVISHHIHTNNEKALKKRIKELENKLNNMQHS